MNCSPKIVRALLFTLVAGCVVAPHCVVGQVSAAETPLGPWPGDVYREFSIHNGGNRNWRVTDPRATAAGAKQFLPNPVLSLQIEDLQHAVRAEALLDRWGGHVGTKEKLIRFNGHDWIELPEIETTPNGHDPERYYSQDNPVVAVPLSHLREGANSIEGTVGKRNKISWGQWGLYSVVIRVYYDSARKGHASGQIVSPRHDEMLAENPVIQIDCGPNAKRVDVLAWYDGYDEDGDGIYHEWHESRFQPQRGAPAAIRDHVGTIDLSKETTPGRITWDTKWVPDQKARSIKLVARIHDVNGMIHVSPIVDRLSLKRDGWTVRQYRASDVPEAFAVRVGQTKSCDISMADSPPLESAKEAVLHYRTWEGTDRHHEPFLLNGHPHQNEGNNHHYDYDRLPIPVRELKKGTNRFTVHSDTKHHMLEVLWPGPAITVRYRVD